MSNSNPQLPRSPGSYLLLLYLRAATCVQVGRLGRVSFRRGWYFYTGSAFGPGGIKGRANHHFQKQKRFHWHIDYLRNVAELRGVCWQVGANQEHAWAAALGELDDACYPVCGFGASDCQCQSHLVYSPRRVNHGRLASILGIKCQGRREAQSQREITGCFDLLLQ